MTHRPAEHLAPREKYDDGIMTPIRWPGDRELCPSQEASGSLSPPALVLTACVRLPQPECVHHLSDVRRLPNVLPDGLADRIRTLGWRMARTFQPGFGMSWQEAFSVSTPDELDHVLVQEMIERTWMPGDVLHTTRRRAAFIDHPHSGEPCWFNDVAFYNAGSLDPVDRAIMMRAFGEDLPMQTTFGDGQPLSAEDLAALQAGYAAVRRDVVWRQGDVVIADNRTTALGRPPLIGSPQFLVALADENDAGLPQPPD